MDPICLCTIMYVTSNINKIFNKKNKKFSPKNYDLRI